MKKLFSLILASMLLVFMLSACGAQTCHYCGKTIEDDPVEAGGRYYCTYDHYMCELFDV